MKFSLWLRSMAALCCLVALAGNAAQPGQRDQTMLPIPAQQQELQQMQINQQQEQTKLQLQQQMQINQQNNQLRSQLNDSEQRVQQNAPANTLPQHP